MTDATVHVLLIEDNPGDARLIREMLVHDAPEAYRIDHADTLADGCALLMSQPCDVLLLDLTLPDSSGIGTLGSVREHDSRVPIVVLTGFDDRALGLLALQMGAQDYLVKGETIGPMLQRVLRYAIERKRIESAEREHLATIEALRDSLAALTSTLDLDEVLDRVLDNIGRVIPHQSANIMLIEGDQARVVRSRTAGLSAPFSSAAFPLPDVPLLEALAQSSDPTPVQQAGFGAEQGGPCAWLAVPIHLQDSVIGLINIYRDHPFEQRDLDRMRLFSEQAAIALRNARLFWNTNALAALKERQRLARDLHDSVTQTLFSATVIAESILRSWRTNPARAEPLVARLHELNTGALAEMRVLLLELRPSALENVSMRDLLTQLILSTRSRKRLDIELDMEPELDLPYAVKESLYRIAQEALNNVIKHSRATEVHIRLHCSGGHCLLTVQDNGGGFEAARRTSSTSLGLSIMRERAEAAGGELTVESSPSAGVKIQAHVPVHTLEGIAS